MEPVSDILLSWFAREGRDLPWRRTRDPYRIWLSEVILQQTRVAQGLEYYLRFTERFPDIAALAAAPEDEVLKLWQGLGYYSRARNLHAAARQVMSRFGGVFPATYGEVRALPGVGDYTAAAIASFAYGAAEVVLDVNVRRVLARLDGGADAPLGAPTAAERRRAAAWLPERHAAVWSVAAMELGAQVCRSARPDCPACPVATSCRWLAAGRPPGPARPRQLYAGTDRAARGHVLAALRALPTGRSADAATLVGGWPDQAQASAALQSLLSDGLVRTDREGYTL